MDVSTFVKGFTSTDEVKSLKEALSDFKAWSSEYKKGCNKRKRLSISAASKSTKSQKVAQLLPGTNSKLGEVLLEMFQNNTVDGIQEDTGVQFAAAEWIIKENTAYALVLSANQNQQLLQDWLALPYYQTEGMDGRKLEEKRRPGAVNQRGCQAPALHQAQQGVAELPGHPCSQEPQGCRHRR